MSRRRWIRCVPPAIIWRYSPFWGTRTEEVRPMTTLNRHGFLKLVSSGSAAIAAAPALSAERWLRETGTGQALTVRAVVGVPTHPLPVYASYVIEGYVHLGTRSGALTTAVY